MKVTKKGKIAYEYFVQCMDTKRLPEIPYVEDGLTAMECFFAHETHGKTLPCKEPELLSRALNGKAWSGLTENMVAEDLVDCLVTAEEVREQYPGFLSKAIIGLAKKIALDRIGFVPSYITGQEPYEKVSTNIVDAVLGTSKCTSS